MTHNPVQDKLSLDIIWSERHKRIGWRKLWTAVARAQSKAGLVTAAQVQELQDNIYNIDMEASMHEELLTRHDLMAEIHVYTKQCPLAAPIIHLGMTSSDVEENTDILRIRDSLVCIINQLHGLITQLDHALSSEAWYLLKDDLQLLSDVRAGLRGKGIKGAVGTSASFVQLLKGTTLTAREMEALVMDELLLWPLQVSTQIATRKQDYIVLSGLCTLAVTLELVARELARDSVLPLVEYNYISNLNNLLRAAMGTAWDNAAHSLLERTLDDSANRRYILPVSFINTEKNIHRILSAMKGKANGE